MDWDDLGRQSGTPGDDSPHPEAELSWWNGETMPEVYEEARPAFDASAAAWLGWDGWEAHEGTEWDVRAVIAQMPQHVKDNFRLDDVPWERFRPGRDGEASAKHWLSQARSPDAGTADHALTMLFHELFCDYHVTARGPLVVPFLIRLAIAADRTARCRRSALGLAASVARFHGHEARRDQFLHTACADWMFTCDGYLENWSIEASRLAITADTDLLLPLLHDPHPEIRTSACDALGTALSDADRITRALHARLAVEPHAVVRASLVLAAADLAHEHALPHAATWLGTLWPDRTRPAEVRVAAALAWYCLTDGPAPDDLRTMVATYVTGDTGDVLAEVPWIARVHYRDQPLATTIDQMLSGSGPAQDAGPL